MRLFRTKKPLLEVLTLLSVAFLTLILLLSAFLCLFLRLDSSEDLSRFVISLDVKIGSCAAIGTLILCVSATLLLSGSWRIAMVRGLAWSFAAFMVFGGGLLSCHAFQNDLRGGDSVEQFRLWLAK